MKIPLSTALLAFVLNLALRAPAQDPRPARPPGAAQRSADATGHDQALGDVLADYGRLVGKRVVMDSTVSANQPLTLPDLEGASPAQRTGLIERAIFLNGFSLFDADADTVVILGPGRNPRSFGLPLYTRPEEMPTGERVFSYACKLEHCDAIEMAGFLTQLIPGSNDVNFTAASKKRIVIVTAPTSVMRTILRVVATLDVAGDGKDGAGH